MDLCLCCPYCITILLFLYPCHSTKWSQSYCNLTFSLNLFSNNPSCPPQFGCCAYGFSQSSCSNEFSSYAWPSLLKSLMKQFLAYLFYSCAFPCNLPSIFQTACLIPECPIWNLCRNLHSRFLLKTLLVNSSPHFGKHWKDQPLCLITRQACLTP